MKIPSGQINLLLAWLLILLGFVSGMVLGLFFHRENWLGGYASFKRRMYRLGHISFFGLGAVNLLFYFTAKSFSATDPLVAIASWTFVFTCILRRSGIRISFWPSRTGSPWATIDCCDPLPNRLCSGT